MKNYTVRLYEPKDYTTWNAFIEKAKNATFLFHRDFMEYHNDRFDDFSLLVFDAEKLVALLPANKKSNAVFSHQGLTYGGLVYDEKTKLETVISVFRSLLSFLHKTGITKLHLKSLPSVYHLKPAAELDYILFLTEAKLIRRDTLSVIDLSKPHSFSEIRKRGIKKAKSNQLVIKEENGFNDFWNKILIPNLASKHNAVPVHSIEEIALLKSRFPENIRQFNVYYNNEIVGGTTIFETKTVAHAQYISANETKAELGSLDFLFAHLITEVFSGKAFFDFGISNEGQGTKLNTGLSYWKESFGAGIICQDFHEIDTAQFSILENVFI